MQLLIYDYNIENSILDSICSNPSPHSHTLAGITGNATNVYITQPGLVYRAERGGAPHRSSLG